MNIFVGSLPFSLEENELREFFEEIIPENISIMVENLNEYRKTLKGDFEEMP